MPSSPVEFSFIRSIQPYTQDVLFKSTLLLNCHPILEPFKINEQEHEKLKLKRVPSSPGGDMLLYILINLFLALKRNLA